MRPGRINLGSRVSNVLALSNHPCTQTIGGSDDDDVPPVPLQTLPNNNEIIIELANLLQ